MYLLSSGRLTGAMTHIQTDQQTASHPTSTGEPHVLVVGATGKTGSRVAARLRAQGIAVRGTSRSGEHPFDWTDPGTWDPALQGVTALYVTFQPDLAVPGAADTIAALADRARVAGARQGVLLSGRGEEEARRAELAFLERLPVATVLRCAWFDQNFTEGALAPGVAAGEISLPAAGDAVEPFLDADDIADCALRVLTSDGHAGRVYELTGPELLTLQQVAQVLSDVVGRPVRYRAQSVDEFAAELSGAGVPEPDASFLAQTFGELFDGRNAAVTSGVRELLGRSPRSFATFAAQAREAEMFDGSAL